MSDTKIESKNQLGLIGAISYIVGTIIGSGIFISPTAILKQTGSIGLSLIVWSASGIFSIIAGLVYVELGTSIRHSGADYAYISYAGWHPLAFAFVWVNTVISGACSCALLADTFGSYIVEALTPLIESAAGCMSEMDKEKMKWCFGFMLLWLLTWANFMSLKNYAARIQIANAAAKIISVALIIGTGLYYYLTNDLANNFSSTNIWKGTKLNAEGLVLAIYAGNWAYAGYTTLNYGAEEIRNYRRTLPIAVVGGLIVIMIIYISANLAYFVVLTPDEMIASSAVASTFSQKTLGNLSYAIPAVVGILMTGTLNSHIFTCSRYSYAAARNGHMPKSWALVNSDTNSPRVSVFVNGLFGFLMAFMFDVEALLKNMVACALLQQATAVAALLYIRYKRIAVHPERIRFPIFIPIAFFIFCLILIVIPIVRNPASSCIGITFTIIGVIGYYVFMVPDTNIPLLNSIDEWTTRFCQIIFWCLLDLRKTTIPPSSINTNTNQEGKVLNSKQKHLMMLRKILPTERNSSFSTATTIARY